MAIQCIFRKMLRAALFTVMVLGISCQMAEFAAASADASNDAAELTESAGTINPLKNRSQYTIFTSDAEVYAIAPDAANNKIYTTWTHCDGSYLCGFDYPAGSTDSDLYSSADLSVAAGRIITNDNEQIVYAFYKSDGTVKVVLDPDGEGSSVDMLGAVYDGAFLLHPELAVGDLDGLVDANGDCHDEIVLLYKISGDDQPFIRLAVLDYNLNELDYVLPENFSETSDIAVTAGDFDGDGVMEIAVAYNTYLTTFRFSKFESGDFGLVKADTVSLDSNCKFAKLVSGDFSGDGKQEIALAYSTGSSVTTQVFSMGTDLSITAKGKISESGKITTRPDITAGLFRLDPENNYNINRRQLALTYMDDQLMKYLHIVTYDIGEDLSITRKAIHTDANGGFIGARISAGNFLDYSPDTPPTMEIFWTILTFEDTPLFYKVFSVNNSLQLTQQWSNVTMFAGGAKKAVTVLADKNGKSYYAGSPMHINVPQLTKPQFILYEPPKHIDYLPDSEDPETWEVINVSRKMELKVSLEDENKQSLEITRKDSTSHDVGQSKSRKFEESLKFGLGIAEVSASAEEENKISKSYESSTEDINSNYQSVSTTFSTETNSDDFIRADFRVLDIWRYPLYGFRTGDMFGFYEIVIPGAPVTVNAGGRNCPDWFQPEHENGNVLSYPYITFADPYTPDDLGSFTTSGETKKIVLASLAGFLDNNAMNGGINWSSEAGSENAKSYESKTTTSKDIKVGASAKVHFGFKAEAGTTYSFNTEESNSWSKDSITSVTNESSTGISLEVPMTVPAQTNYAYYDDTAVYISQDGTMKVAHGVNVDESGEGVDWWKDGYGKKPDPALNLPTKFTGYVIITYAGKEMEWRLTEDETRKQMRGFFIRNTEANQDTGVKEYLGNSLVDGDSVELVARIYNYSLYNQPTDLFDIVFSYVSIDSATGLMDTERTNIGTVTTSLARLDKKEVSVVWDTTGLGGETQGQANYYTIYVTIDPDDRIDEIHELNETITVKEEVKEEEVTKTLTLGNNEGYYPWHNGIAVYHKDTTGQTFVGANPPGDVRVHGASLAIEVKPEKLDSQDANVKAGEKYRLRAHILSDGHDVAYRHVLFYDNDELVSAKMIHGLNNGETHVWTDWMPREAGTHNLQVRILENPDDPSPGNNTDTLSVTVKSDDGGKRERHRRREAFVQSR